ncbi:chloride channel protein [Rhizobium leguminosarum]|uniref:CBS domain-containing protein n=2 Tax=Rhizobium TaxID=379 RepID=A0A6P0DE65_RHILE|nr:chloride channel protein [Rhizobium leguminosarum]ASS59687.1 chloride channel protein [Rhizobium leguminosarum bv. viciae]AVC45927.1 voltage gated chloride channel family protein [Rhizobium leguminosarum bv. viciae]MBB4330848.1 H+/Cl- antiporter ClcA/predicted transcriptional regulator [Rhizobium leguminosarum]MBB4340554.1 H+/Cl- antiporter ClcA/predicted transcriptional regulator [Rhizobium leguminosarum]MBB4356035.1 H+/Cl- antiporter ClcA/predicted transcriptional regulator [Rhizobium leg
MAQHQPSNRPHDFTGGLSRREAGDFTTDRRVLLLVGMSIIVGTAGAFAAWCLVSLIALVTNVIWFGEIGIQPASLAAVPRSLWVVLVPPLGGLVIGLMARFGSEKIRGHGIPEAIEAILIGGSRMSPKVAVLKPLSSAISIGTGGPFGAEGPIIMTGGAIGSLFAQFFHMSAAERKTLLVAGAAAGMTAIFGSPIAAVMLAVELLLFEWKPRSFIPVAVAACVSICWRPLLFGTGPLFPTHFQVDLPWWGIFACAAMGIISGLQSGLLTTLLYRIEDLFETLPIHWMWWPMLGGLVIGLGGLIEPRAMGVGYDIIDGLLNNRLLAPAVMSILLVKTVIWLFALSSGTSGGVLAPLLIFGGALGWLVGLLMPGNDPGFWALLGMAAMMGGTMRAPLTGTFFAMEITGDVSALVPLLAATVVAYAVTVLLLRRSILTEKIARRGQHITREYGVDPFELSRATEIMISDVDTLPVTMTVGEACDFFASQQKTHRIYPVVDAAGRLAGVVSRADALLWQGNPDLASQTLAENVTDDSVPVGHPDDTVAFIADLMLSTGDGRIPIVDPTSGKLCGLIARKDLLRLRSSYRSAELDRRPYLTAGARSKLQ